MESSTASLQRISMQRLIDAMLSDSTLDALEYLCGSEYTWSGTDQLMEMQQKYTWTLA